ncbi:hypothetical protein [Streptomyces sp. NPDC054797]
MSVRRLRQAAAPPEAEGDPTGSPDRTARPDRPAGSPSRIARPLAAAAQRERGLGREAFRGGVYGAAVRLA